MTKPKGPFGSKRNLRALCEAVGFLSIYWAILERQMDNCIVLIFTDLGGHEIEPVKPIALKRKARFLNRAFKKIDKLAPFKEQALTLLAGATKLALDRHLFLHGCIVKLEGTILHISRYFPADPGYRTQHAKFDFQKYPALTEELERLASGWIGLSQTLLDTFRPQTQIPNPPPRKAGRSARILKKGPRPRS